MTVRCGNLDLTRHLLEHEGAPIACVTPRDVEYNFSQPLLELLVDRGWDVNAEEKSESDGGRQRLVDLVCDRGETVRWLVEKGARVDHGQSYYEIAPQPAPLLETCAALGSVSTFKFLRDRGAPMGVRTLHRAAGSAASIGADPALEDGGSGGESGDEGEDEEEAADSAQRRRQRADMLRYLVDELGLEVNTMDTDVQGHAEYWGPPVSYAAARRRGERVVAWLLERGADPRVRNVLSGADAEGVAREEGCEGTAEVISRWKDEHAKEYQLG